MSKRFVCAVLLLAMLLSLVIPSLVFEAHAAEEGETASGSVHHADENAPDLEDPERIREVEKTNAEIEQYMRETGFKTYTVQNPPEESWLLTLLPYLIIFAAMFIFFMIMRQQIQAAEAR